MVIGKKVLGGLLVLMGIAAFLGWFVKISEGEIVSLKDPYEYIVPIILIVWGFSLLKEKKDINSALVQYAGPFKRTIAILIDAVLVIAIIMAKEGLCPIISYKLYYLLTVYSIFVITLISIWFLFRFGATPGKMIMGIVVRKRDFSKIDLKNAFMRSLVDLIMAFFSIVAASMALSSINYPEHQALISFERLAHLSERYPDWWENYYDVVVNWWMWSEVIVMMFNKERRAIHDYIAGTVVVTKKSLLASEANAKHS